MKKKRTRYLIQPRGAEKWVETPAATVQELKAAGHALTLDRHEGAERDLVFISIEIPE